MNPRFEGPHKEFARLIQSKFKVGKTPPAAFSGLAPTFLKRFNQATKERAGYKPPYYTIIGHTAFVVNANTVDFTCPLNKIELEAISYHIAELKHEVLPSKSKYRF